MAVLIDVFLNSGERKHIPLWREYRVSECRLMYNFIESSTKKREQITADRSSAKSSTAK